ncbi:ATP-grasp domain-containing protein [Zooshikella ganghwensis]|uniref:ATP-grasp domain-containing protein n=1 Tax=Zooshikella ganghwensis TaxID=202772 RepID=A0A4P9VL00_9GAMM|nr:ATP-grasp domain-containing protein [Zooshikella ganghwensis]RDH43943.1 ATP-grasp domain-containing protein [Zooshikella ganghwensis]
MKKVALIGGWDALVDLVTDLGYELYLYYFDNDSYSEPYLNRCSLAVKMPCENREALLTTVSSHHKKYHYDLIYSHKELLQETTSFISETLGVNGLNQQAVKLFRNKFEFRKLLENLGDYTVRWAKVDSQAQVSQFLNNIKGPIIVKPYDGMGSRRIRKLTENDNLNIPDNLDITNGSLFIAEEYIAGKEYSAEFISIDGKHHLVGITSKTTSESPYFFEISHTFPASLPAGMLTEVCTAISAMLTQAKYDYGASHTEFKLNDSRVVLIESHTRVAGDKIPILIKESCGYDIIRENLQTLLRASTQAPPNNQFWQPTSIVYFYGEGGTLSQDTFLDTIKNECGEKLLLLKFDYNVGDLLPETVSSSTRYGFVIITNTNSELLSNIIHLFNLSEHLQPS